MRRRELAEMRLAEASNLPPPPGAPPAAPPGPPPPAGGPSTLERMRQKQLAAAVMDVIAVEERAAPPAVDGPGPLVAGKTQPSIVYHRRFRPRRTGRCGRRENRSDARPPRPHTEELALA